MLYSSPSSVIALLLATKKSAVRISRQIPSLSSTERPLTKGVRNLTGRFLISLIRPICDNVTDPPMPTVAPSGIIFQNSANASADFGKKRASKLFFLSALIVLSAAKFRYHW